MNDVQISTWFLRELWGRAVGQPPDRLDIEYAMNLIPYIERAETKEDLEDFLTRPFLPDKDRIVRYVNQMMKKYWSAALSQTP